MKPQFKVFVGSLTSLLYLSGCTGSGTSGADINTALANIYGKVSTSATTQSIALNGKMQAPQNAGKRYSKVGDSYSMAVSGCTVTAADIETGETVATTTTADDGTYTLTGVTDGQAYKVVADCGTEKFSILKSADTTAPADKTPAATNPLSTYIAAKILDSIFTALDSFSGLPDSVKTLLKDKIQQTIVETITQMSATFEAAADSGTLEIPSATEAKDLAEKIDQASSSDSTKKGALRTATNNYETVKPLPPAVEQTVNGGKANSEVAMNCDKSNTTSSVESCTKAVTKLIYNSLGFSVVIKTSGGAFGDVTCNSSGVGQDLPNGEYKDHNVEAQIPEGICVISPKVARMDRNQNSKGENNGGGAIFAETIEGVFPTGYLTELGASLYQGYKYSLSDVNKFIFGHDAESGAGMNGRVIGMANGWNETNRSPMPNLFYKVANGNWTMLATPPPPLQYGIWGLMGCINDDWSFNENGIWKGEGDGCNNPAYKSDYAALVKNIGDSDFVSKPLLASKFGGTIPSQAKLDEFFDNGRVHLDYNPSGEKELYVLFADNPVWQSEVKKGDETTIVRPCEDNDPKTICGDKDGKSLAIRVDVKLGDKVGDQRPISALLKNDSGEYFLQPVFGAFGFTGGFLLIRVADGSYMRDDFFNMRAIKTILTPDECGTKNFPAPGGENGCATGKVYSVKLAFDNQGPSFEAIGASPVALKDGDQVRPTLDIQSRVKQNYQEQSGDIWTPPHVAYGNWGQLQDITVNLNSDNSLSAGPDYKVVAAWNCGPDGCNQNQYYLVDSNTGLPPSFDSLCPQPSDQQTPPSSGCLFVNYQNSDGSWVMKATKKYLEADFNPESGPFQLDDQGSENITWASTLEYVVPSGPVENLASKCSMEPFFIDGNGDGKLNCDSKDAGATGGDISFSNEAQAINYISRQNEQIQYRPNENGYAYKDPAGAKKLMSTAFPGWFDGKHTLDANTQLNGLQGLALIWLFMEEGGGNGFRLDVQTLPRNTRFQTMIPFMENGGDDGMSKVIKLNQAFGAALTTFKQK